MPALRLGACILAAGSSRRFGGDKRLAQLSADTTVLAATLQLISSSFDETLVVVREHEADLAHELQRQFRIRAICAKDSALGMGHSIAAASQHFDGWDGVALCLGDMPFVKSETLAQLSRSFTNQFASKPIVAPLYNNQSGHPVLFHRAYFAEMEKLAGDNGAKSIVQNAREHVIRIAVDDPGVLADIDQPDDLPKPDA